MASDAWAGRPEDETAWLAYRRGLAGEGKSPSTVGGYRRSLESLSRTLPEGAALDECEAAHVADWLARGAAGELPGQAAPWAKSTLASHSRRARTYFTWAVRSEMAETHPMISIKPVHEDVREIPVPDKEHVRTLVAMLAGRKDYESRRDLAMIAVLAEPGTPRATEMGMLTSEGLDLRSDQLRFMGKGGLERTIALGNYSSHVLTLYARARAKHKDARLPWLFLGKKGQLTRSGVRQMLRRRCREAGVPVIPPHHFRHLTASEFFEAGGQTVDAMKLFGWRTPMMAARYGGAVAGRRAVRHAREMSIGDQITGGGAQRKRAG